MIDLYYCGTPNGQKMTMFLEEAELPYRIIPVGLGKGEQFKPEFLAISPNNKIPAMVDHDPPGGGTPVSLFESGAYSIADIACYPWIVPHAAHCQDLDDFPHLKRWFETIAARPATVRAYKGSTDVYSRQGQPLSDEARRTLFGQSAASVR